jgi:hypothetical protein
VINYRASYIKETSKIVQYFLKSKKIKSSEIAVFDQADSYGEA